jgi:hypothetical protein
MVQASCNPFKEDRALKGVNLGEIKDEVLDVFRKEFEGLKITFGIIKRVAEQEADFSSVGFTFKDMEAIYGESPSYKIDGGENLKEILNNISSKLYRGLSQKQKELLNKVSVNGFDVIRANSGGHKCITNISGINFLYRDNKGGKTDKIPSELLPIANYSGKNSFLNDIKSKLLTYGRLSDKQIEMAMNQIKKEGGSPSPSPSTETVASQSNKTYVDVVKQIQQEFVNILNNKIKSQSEGITESFNKGENVESLLKSHVKGQKVLSEREWKFIMSKLNAVTDNRGQWDHPGRCTMIESNRITMENVNFPLVGIDNTGHLKLMLPENDYKFPGKRVFEIPLKGKYKNLGIKLLKTI